MKKLLYLKPNTLIVKVEAQAMLASGSISGGTGTISTGGFQRTGGQEEAMDVKYKGTWTHTTDDTSSDWDNFSVN